MTRQKKRADEFPVDENNVPAHCYTNPSESINHVMSEQKNLAGYKKSTTSPNCNSFWMFKSQLCKYKAGRLKVQSREQLQIKSSG